MHDRPPKKKKYTVRLEEGFDVERVIDRLLEGHNDLMTLKEILASAPRLRDELKERLSRRLVPNVHLGTILPKEAKWAESGTKMDWKCVACGTVYLVVKGSKCAAMVDTGAEMNIIREADAIRFGLDIDRSDCGILHGASCKAVFCGTTSNVLIEVGKVKAKACFFIIPDVDHGILLGRSFLSRTETVIFNKHDETLILLLNDPACGNYEIITCRNTGPRSIRNRPNPGSFTIEESESERRRLWAEPEGEEKVEAFSLSLSDVGKAMDLVAVHEMAYPDVIQALREQWMMELELVSSHSLVGDMRTIEEGPGQVEQHEDLMGGMYFLVNTLLQKSLNQSGSLNPAGNVDEVPESQDDEFEEGGIEEVFRAEEYDGIYLELGLLLSCKMRLRNASDRAQRMLQRYLVRDGHLFVRREVGNPRRIVCGRNRQIDVIAALHDGIAGGHREVQAMYAKISELYYWDGMMDMVGKFCRSCVPCQERSRLRQGEPLHPRLEREMGAVVHLDLLFMPLGDQGYNYIFDAHDNLSGFVDGRAIRTKTGPVLVSCIEEYYLRYPFVREFVMDRGSEFTCQEVQELLSRSDFTKTAMPIGGKGTRPPRRPLGASGGYEWHGPHHRESTPEYDGDDIELFLDKFWEHARRMGWTVTQGIERLRGVGKFEEPVARVRKEATTRSKVELRVQELRPSPVGPDVGPIRLEIGNASNFIPAFEWFMQGQVELHRFTEGGLRRSPACTQEEPPASEGPLRELEAHLDISRWRASPRGEEHGEQAEAVPREEVPREEVPHKEGKVDKPESSRQGEQRQPGQGLPGQLSAAGPRREPPMGRVILESEEARAQREAEREAFEFRAPTELAMLPVAAADPVVPLAVKEGLPPSSSEPAAEGSMGVLLEAVHSMQEEPSLFSPEQRIEEPLEREMGIEAEGVIEGELQRLGMPEYELEEIEEQPMVMPGEMLERRPQRLDVPECVSATGDLRSRLGSWATGSGSGGPVSGIEQQEVVSTAAPRSEQQGVVSTMVGSLSLPPPQPKKKKFRRKVDQLCFYCKRGMHQTLDCLEFLEDKAEGKVSEAGGKMYDRQGRMVEKSADGIRA
ncbi:hypothetical protein CBR_g29676 [Chara braunii]|uniref:Integrase zinc-binding domain-containing protein n=1 Tax=Chara braunii TaxID=69332 RepID=A0A388LB42_CHABU|nr:hypothetical protein CBR_g29676 [Chara braunii]|eukprot:GBG79529.1 hypothetical protein CBR_g29676 [Chara braunii]